jgi:hypothetical protein
MATGRSPSRWKRADRNDPLQFGPSNVAIWSVSLPVEMLDGSTAVKRAERASPALAKLTPAAVISKDHYSAQRLGMYWVDVGRAYLYRADQDRALKAVLKAEQIAPECPYARPRQPSGVGLAGKPNA